MKKLFILLTVLFLISCNTNSDTTVGYTHKVRLKRLGFDNKGNTYRTTVTKVLNIDTGYHPGDKIYDQELQTYYIYPLN